MDYFSLFGLPASYQIDVEQLTFLFYDLQRQYHPDKFVNATKLEQSIALQKSTAINQAWKILKDPFMRAEYLLSLHGFDFSNERYIENDKTFMIKQLELQEELDDIQKEKDETRLSMFIKRIQEMLNVRYVQMVEKLNNEKWNIAADIVCKLRFLNKLQSGAKQFEEELLDSKF